MKAAIVALIIAGSAIAQCVPAPQPSWLPVVKWKVHPPILETLAPGASAVAAASVPPSRVGAAVIHVKAEFPVSVWFGNKHLCAVENRKTGTVGCPLPAGSGPLVIKDDRGAAATAENEISVTWASLGVSTRRPRGQSAVTRSLVSQPDTAVPPGRLTYYTVTVPDGDTAYVGGTFRAQGGSGNDIYVYLVGQNGLANLMNGHEFRSYYATAGAQTAGEMNVGPLAPGTYYLVFDNRFSAVSNKVVASDIELVLDSHSR